ncbi:MAG: PmoA family protein [Phycisphaeraceae bacterium]|nr:PmoA family protein [Phycisphaeraceae bacterium]
MKRYAALIFALLSIAQPICAQGWQEKEKAKVEIKPGIDIVNLVDKPFTALIRGKTEAYGEARIPYFYPIVGPTGAKMTRDFPMIKGVEGESDDHPHHQSLWLAHGNVNGVDFWHDKKAKIESSKTTPRILFPQKKETSPSGPFVAYERTDTWLEPGGDPILTNNTAYAADVLKDGARVLELWHNLAPADAVDEIIFGDTKEGTMAIRLAPQLRLKGGVATGKAINSNGDKDGKVWGKRAKWVAYWGMIDGETCGVAIFDHPTNLRHPTWWHARDYGLVTANPFGISDFEKLKPRGKGKYTLKRGQELKLRYRFVFFAGTAEEADIAGKYDQWIEETMQRKPEKNQADPNKE